MENTDEYTETLKELSLKYAGQKTQGNVSDFIDEGELELASICILGTVDCLWHRKAISDAEAKEVLALLRISPEEKARIRSRSRYRSDGLTQ